MPRGRGRRDPDDARPSAHRARDRARGRGGAVAQRRSDHGRDVASPPRIELRGLLDSPEVIFARIAADQKIRIVEVLKQQGHVVAVTGDGVKDGARIEERPRRCRHGHHGHGRGEGAVGMVLLDDNFASIVNAIEEGRAVFENIRKFLTYILAHNVPELVPYLAFSLFAIPLPLTPIQILSTTGNRLADRPRQRARGARSASHAPTPTVTGDRAVQWLAGLRAYLLEGLTEASRPWRRSCYTVGGGRTKAPPEPSPHISLKATTACLSAVIVMQVSVPLSQRDPVSMVHRATETLILWGVLLEVALILLIGVGQCHLWNRARFGACWLFVMPFAVGLLVLEELRKWLVRGNIRGRAGESPRGQPVRHPPEESPTWAWEGGRPARRDSG